MNRDRFERLVSDWLDDPADASLRAQLDQSIAADSSLADSHRELQTLNAVMTRGALDERAVRWDRLAAAIRNEVSNSVIAGRDDARLDEALAAWSDEKRVDWARSRERIATAIDAEPRRLRVRAPARTIRMAVGLLAAAAAIALMAIWQPNVPQIDRPGSAVAIARIEAAPASTSTTGVAYARIEPAVGAPAVARGTALLDPADMEDILLVISPAEANPSSVGAGL
ncbi:MAG: hypothetical protein U1D55_04835 [Phycisphaerae bacterium]